MDLCHAIDKRDAVAAEVTSLNAQIGELEARLSVVEKGIALLCEQKRKDELIGHVSSVVNKRPTMAAALASKR